MGDDHPVVQELHPLAGRRAVGPGCVPPPGQRGTPLWELGAWWEPARYLDDVMGEGIAEHPVQRDALVLQDVLGTRGSHCCPTTMDGPGMGDSIHPGEPGPRRYLEAPARAVLGQDADVRGVGAGADEAGQMLVLDIPHLRWSRVWDQAHAQLGTPTPPPGTEPGATYVFQLEQDLARQLDALAVEVLHGHEVALGRDAG